MTKNPISTTPHVVSESFGYLDNEHRFGVWYMRVVLKTYVLISKQILLLRPCGGGGCILHVKRRGWNNHPFNSRIPADTCNLL